MKKLIPDEKNWKDKLSKFFNTKGFYVILAVCIIIVAATAIYVTTQNMGSPDTGINNEKIIPGDANANNGQEDETKAVTGTAEKDGAANQTAAANPTTAANSATKDATKDAATQPKTAPAASKSVVTFIRPVDGSIMKDFTRDVNTFAESKTLGDVRAHMGIDFKVDKLTKVRAVADGTVSLVQNDANGIVVEITHGNGLKTRYAGLSSQGLEDISTGLKVKANEIIGLVGDPIQSEWEDGAHLHFEVIKDGKSVDPAPYLKASTTAQPQGK